MWRVGYEFDRMVQLCGTKQHSNAYVWSNSEFIRLYSVMSALILHPDMFRHKIYLSSVHQLIARSRAKGFLAFL